MAEPLSEAEVSRQVTHELDRAQTFLDNRIGFERAAAYDYYYGREFGNETEGRSRVVSADVAQAVDAAVPAILKIFVSGDKAVEFSPRGAEDVESSEQATVAANYVFFTQNPGFALAHDFIKDGLLQKTGVFKWRWDTSVTMKEKRYQGLDDQTLAMLDSDPDTEIVEHTEYPDPMMSPGIMGSTGMEPPPGQEPPQQPMLHDVTVRVRKETGRIRIIVPPPEEIMISPDSMSLEVMDMPFIAHCPLLTASDLFELGVSQEVIAELPEGDRDYLYSQERIARKNRTDSASSLLDEGSAGGAEGVYRYNECYIRIDEDGDGIAELRKICMVADTILHDEPVDHIPMAIWTPKVMPHEVVGISLADDVMDIQLLKSTIWRQSMDNLYLSNSPRIFVKGDVNMDDLLSVKPGGAIRGDLNSSVEPMIVPFTAGASFQMLEFSDQEKDARVGFSALGPGLDPSSINKTATFVDAMSAQRGERAEMIARNAAEYGFKPLFKGIMYLLAKHQQQALMVRLNNKFVPIDPETWSKEYDMTVNVGLGLGSKDKQLMHLNGLSQDIGMALNSPFGQQLVDAKKLYNLTEKKAELAGFRDVTLFMNDPETQPPPQPPGPPPEVQIAQMEIQADQQKFQAQAQLDQQKAAQDQQAEAQKAAMEMQTQQQEIESRAQLEQFKIEKQMELEQFKVEKQAELERYKADLNAQVQRETAMIGAHSKMKAAYASSKMDDPEDEGVKAEKAQEREESRFLLTQIAQLIQASNGPKEIVRDKNGRALGVRPV